MLNYWQIVMRYARVLYKLLENTPIPQMMYPSSMTDTLRRHTWHENICRYFGIFRFAIED